MRPILIVLSIALVACGNSEPKIYQSNKAEAVTSDSDIGITLW